MIWRIFKKDLKLSWPLALAVAVFHGIGPIWMMLRHYIVSGPIVAWLQIQIAGGMLARAFLIIAVAQQDALPGVRQDWLIRPIRRRDLLSAKLLYVMAVVQLPIFVVDTVFNLGTGAPALPSFWAAAMHSLTQFVGLDVPFLAFGSITANLLEAVGGAALGALAIGLYDSVSSILGPSWRPVSFSPSVSWILSASSLLALLLGSVAILRIQYFRRSTSAARIGAMGTLALCLAMAFLPWRLIYSIERSILGAPASASHPQVTFDPTAEKFHPEGGLTVEDARALLMQNNGVLVTHLPIRVTGLAPGSAIQSDHTDARLIEANGHASSLLQARWIVRPDESGSAAKPVYPALEIPATLYNRIKDQPVRIEFDSWLTLVEKVSTSTLPALGGDRQIPGIGWCRTMINPTQTSVQFSCLGTQPEPPCWDLFLKHLSSGQRNPARFSCGSYAPVIIEPTMPVALSRPGVTLPFRDPSGLAHFPVDGSKLRNSEVVVDSYRIREHFQSNLVIPQIRLSDWEGDAP